MSIIIAIVGFSLLAVVAILDKFIVTTDRIRPVVVTFYSTAPLALIFVLLPFRVAALQGFTDWMVAIMSGAAFLGALWAMYTAFVKSEVSHSGPLIGAATALSAAVLSALFLGEVMAGWQYVGIALLIVGSALVSFKQTRRVWGWNTGVLWAILAGLLFAVSHVAAKYIYDRYGFYSGLVWTRGLIGLLGLCLAGFPAVCRTFRRRARPADGRSRKNKILLVATDKILGVAAVVALQYASAIGSVTAVNALAGVQYALLIILVAALSRFFPHWFKEDYAKGEKLQEGIAVAVIAIGLWLLIG
jgi:drug/metabolite transporter (DMT)-like permease